MPPREDPQTYTLNTEEGRRRIKSKLQSLEKLLESAALSTLQRQDQKWYQEWKPKYEEYLKTTALSAAASAASSASAAVSVAAAGKKKTSESSQLSDPTSSGGSTSQPVRQQLPSPIMSEGVPKGNEITAISLFSGAAGEDAEIWIKKVERCGKTFNWKDECKAGAACLRLSDAAEAWVESNTRQGVDLTAKPWEDFKKLFINRFKPLPDAIKAAECVMDLQQKDSETIGAFYDRVLISMDKKNFSYSAEDKTQKAYTDARDADAFI